MAVAGSLRRGDFAEHVRVGVPGGVNDHLSVPQWKVVAAMVARYACGARLSVVGVPFGADETWLTDERVDVMLGVLEPRVAHLDEAPIASCKRVLVVACEHPLVEKGYADIDDLKGAHILVESLADERWMSPWLLGDVEPTPAWTTYPLRGTTIAPLKPPVQAGECIVIAAEVCTPWLLGELAVLPLADVPSLMTRALFRAGDRRPAVAGVIDALRMLATLGAR